MITEGLKINFTATPTSTCNGNGSISISNVSGGTGAPYQYLITNLPSGHPYAGAWVTATVFNNLPPTTYFVKVRDAGSCSNQPPVSIVVGSNAGILATIGGNSTVCFGNTTALTATATGGSAPFTYYWIKPNASSATTQSLQGGVGNFFVTVTDANGCVASAMKTVTGVVGVTASITGNTALCTTASTTLTATGFSGTPPYNFTWNTGKTGTTNNSTSGVSTTVGAGNYCVTITDASGCSSTLCKTVTASTLAAAVVKQNNCSSPLTTLTATATYGLAPYSYSWSNGNTTNTVNVGAGTYAVTVTDAGGCTVVKNTTVTTPSVLTLTLDSTVNVKCNGGATGKIFTTATGGNGPKTFTINNFSTTQTGSNFSNLAIGTYTVQAKDGNGCLSNTVSATLTEAASALSFTTSKLNVSCNGANNGAITVYANGGVAPLNYSSDNGSNWQTSATLTGLTARNYAVRVRDANGCRSDNQTVTLTQPTALSFVTIKEDPTCSTTNDGKIRVRYINGGNGGPYLFSKDNGATWQTDSVFSSLAPATYLIRVRDYYSCQSAVRTIVVAQPAAPTFATTVGNITCGFASNGVIAVTSVGGGAAPYQYSRGSNFQTSANFTGLTVGTYPMQVKDAKGCLSTVKNTNVGNDCAAPSPLIEFVPTQLIPVIIARTAPNPAVDELRLEVRSLDKRVQQFDFIDASGKPILSEKRPLEAGFNRLSFNISTLPQGTYFIQTPNAPVGKNQPRVFMKM